MTPKDILNFSEITQILHIKSTLKMKENLNENHEKRYKNIKNILGKLSVSYIINFLIERVERVFIGIIKKFSQKEFHVPRSYEVDKIKNVMKMIR